MINVSFSQTRSTVTTEHHNVITRISGLIDNFQLKEAHRLCDSMIDVGLKINNGELLASIYNNKGTVCREENDAKGAIDCFNKSLEYNAALKNEKRLGENYVNLGSIYNFIEEKQTALKYYFKAISILQREKDHHALAVLYNNIGNIYLDQKQLVNADHYLQKALQVSRSLNDTLSLARVYHNLGNSKAIAKQIDSSVYYFNVSLSYLRNFDEGFGHMYNYVQLGAAYLELKRGLEAENLLNKALRIAKAAESYDDQSMIYKLLAKTYSMKGDNKKAFDCLNMYAELNDSLKVQGIKDELIKIQYETDLKNQKKEQDLVRENQEAINKAKIESKNKNLYLSYTALGFAVIMGLLILNGYRQKQKANKIISKQKEEVELKNSEILASINYAKRIQYALLAHKEFMQQNFSEHFVLFDPKDIVSGDFYWATKHNNKLYLAVCDSTGHGVPGAFMCLLNIGFLSEAINEKNITEPNKIFDHVRARLIDSISKEGQKDGFDGILICIDGKKVTYAAANNAPILVSGGSAIELEKDKMPVGIGEKKDAFKLHELNPKPGDTVYLYTDGYADQFGGPKGKKYKYKQLNDNLLAWSNLKMEEQRSNLADDFKRWRGNLEQVDDVCVIGIRL